MGFPVPDVRQGWKGGVGGLQNHLHIVPPTQKGTARTVSQLKAAIPSAWCRSLLCGQSWLLVKG